MSYKLEFDNSTIRKDFWRKVLLWGAIILDVVALLSLVPAIFKILEYLIILPLALALSILFRLLSRRFIVTTTLIFRPNSIDIVKKYVHKTILSKSIQFSKIKNINETKFDNFEEFKKIKTAIYEEKGFVACEFSCKLDMFMIELNDGKRVLINADKYAYALFVTNVEEFL